MPQYRDPIVVEVGTSLAAAPNNLLVMPKAAQPTREGRPTQAIMHIDVVSLCNFTRAGSLVDIGFMVGSHITWSRTIDLTNGSRWYRNHVHYTLTSDYQVVARFNLVTEGAGARIGDHVQMNVNGYFLEPYTSP